MCTHREQLHSRQKHKNDMRHTQLGSTEEVDTLTHEPITHRQTQCVFMLFLNFLF